MFVEGDKAPADVGALFDKHDTGHRAFLVHIDRTTVTQKKALFAAHTLFYTLLAGLIVWRVYTVPAHYVPGLALMASLPLSLFRQPGAWFWYLLNATIDLYFLRSFAPYTAIWAFLAGPAYYRLRVGFRAEEPVLRVPTGSGLKVLAGLAPDAQVTRFREALGRAADDRELARTSALGLAVPVWVPDYAAMRAASAAGARGDGAYELGLWAHAGGVWTRQAEVGQMWRLQEPQQGSPLTKLLEAKLKAMGKSDLYDRFIKLSESTQGELTDESYEQMIRMFAAEGLDGERLWKEVWAEVQASNAR